MKNKFTVPATRSKHNKIRDLYKEINEFRKGYQPITNFVTDENFDLFAYSHHILNRWKKYFSLDY
jgi:hypothetical protein